MWCCSAAPGINPLPAQSIESDEPVDVIEGPTYRMWADEAAGCLFVSWSQEASFADVADQLRAHAEHAVWSRLPIKISDFRSFRPRFTADDLRALVLLNEQLKDRLGIKKVAVIVTPELTETRGWVYTAVSQTLPWATQVFVDYPSARTWLGLPAAYRDPFEALAAV